jgi:hypothetical protein
MQQTRLAAQQANGKEWITCGEADATLHFSN